MFAGRCFYRTVKASAVVYIENLMGGSEKDFAREVFVFSQDFWDGIHNEHVQLSYWWGEFALGGHIL